jgi:hypothetical protein
MSEDINVLFGSPVAIRAFHSQTGGTSFYDLEVLFWEVLTMTIAEILPERRANSDLAVAAVLWLGRGSGPSH